MKRSIGLDIVRSTAIICVLLVHGLDIFIFPLAAKTPLNELLYRICCFLGCIGVEIFFVLSGFLIGRILFRHLQGDNWFGELKIFWFRRWLRTLPLYYFVLFFLVWQSGQLDFPWHHIFFLQNFFPAALGFFPVSWSLAIEEWYYLLIPFGTLFFLRNVQKKEEWLGRIILGIILFSTLLRFIYVGLFNPVYDDGVRKMVFLHFDALALGWGAAYLKYYRQRIYGRLFRLAGCFGWLLFFSSLTYFCLTYRALDTDWWAKTGLFSLVSLAAVCFLLRLEGVQVKRGKRLITACSLYSYGFYLVHLSVFGAVKDAFPTASLAGGAVGLLTAYAGTVISALVLYRAVELPFLQLRDKLFTVKNCKR